MGHFHNILFVLVLYKQTRDESVSYQSLKRFLTVTELQENVFIWDNTEHNIYLSPAYNRGLDYAYTHHHQWIVLLDQDTILSAEYFQHLEHINTLNNVTVYVPTLTMDGKYSASLSSE